MERRARIGLSWSASLLLTASFGVLPAGLGASSGPGSDDIEIRVDTSGSDHLDTAIRDPEPVSSGSGSGDRDVYEAPTTSDSNIDSSGHGDGSSTIDSSDSSGSGSESSGSSGNSGSGSDDSSGSSSSGSGSGSDDSGSGSSGSGSSGSGVSGSDDAGNAVDAQAFHNLAAEQAPAFDDHGYPARHGEVVAVDLPPAALAAARGLGFTVVEAVPLAGLKMEIVRLAVPAGMTVAAALALLTTAAPGGAIDYGHYFALDVGPAGGVDRARHAALAPRARRRGSLEIGMIDTAVAAHPMLRGVTVEMHDVGAAGARRPVAHGTAIASLLAAEGASRLRVANVFHATVGRPYASADAIVRGLDWLAAQGVKVINVSLAGPRNAIVDRAVERAAALGFVIVAAAGNGGPSAPPAYPAAIAGTIAVTAVDGTNRIYRYANRGDYIAFASRGVEIAAALADGTVAAHSGTSFAAPTIAARFAECLAQRGLTVPACRTRIEKSARDLGAPGRDPVFGFGLVD